MKYGRAVYIASLVLYLLLLSLGCDSQSGRRLGSIVYYTEEMSRVTVKNNIVYKQSAKMDVYSPTDAEEDDAYPAVVVVHGKSGEANLKDTNAYRSWGELLAASGFTGVVFNWTAAGDIADLITHVRENAGEYRIDSQRVAVIAFSAGVDAGFREPVKMQGDFVKALVGYYGAPPRDILSVPDSLPPILLAVAGSDSEGFIRANNSFHEQGIHQGCNITLLQHPTGRHGFDLFNNDEVSRDIIAQTIDFLRRNLD